MSSEFELDEISQIFFEECLEGLDIMEQGLLGLEDGEADAEIMNDIFRAAHSIKGGAGTFGFMEISEFTHGVETLLDEMRSGDRDVTPDAVQLLLRSVDRLREMMDEIQSGNDVDVSKNEQLQAEITSMLENEEVSEVIAADQNKQNESVQKFDLVDVDEDQGESKLEGETHWEIEFIPNIDIMQKGNDPLRIFNELQKLGDLKVKANHSELPNLNELVVDNCYLHWTLNLIGPVNEEQIYDVFDWVLEDCELKVTEVLEWMPNNGKDDQERNSQEKPSIENAKANQEISEEIAAVPAEKPAKKSAAVAKPNTKESPAKSTAAAKPANKESTSIRVSIEKVDSLLNLVGELVITQSMLKRFEAECDSEELKDLGDGLIQLERYTRELQESVMEIRMLPISFTFNRFPRLVHDISRKLGKKVELEVIGEQTEIDKTVLEKIGDPLVHLVRNSLDHGIESPEQRLENGKPEMGKLTLSASQEGGNIVIRIIDDGAGLNRDKLLKKAIEKNLVSPEDQLSDERIHNLIFHAGFSTVDEVSDLSGRGVGMDVVRRNIKDLGGRVEVQSELGVGTSFTISLPLTLAILDGQLVRVGNETYIISLVSIVETVLLNAQQVQSIVGTSKVYQMRGEYIPIVCLNEVLQGQQGLKKNSEGLLVVVEADGRRVGLFVDELLDQQQVVIKNLEDNFLQIDGLSGATILGDGTVALILDIPGVLQNCLANLDSLAAEKCAA